jgi:hypothetical protein
MKRILLCSFALLATAAFAEQGSLATLKFDPASPKAGQEVKITIGADGEAPTFCGLVVRFDDGSESQFKIDSKENKLPLTFVKVFAKAGTYAVKAEGRKITTHLPCLGHVEQRLTVAPANEPVAAVAGKAAAPACPDGYKLKGKVGKKGDFTCTAGKGATKPEKALDCANGLEYFQTRTALGCRKEKK